MIKYLLLINMTISPVCFGHDAEDPTVRQLTIKRSFRSKMQETAKNYVDFHTHKEIFTINNNKVLLNPSKIDIENLGERFIQHLTDLTVRNQYTTYYKESLKTIKRYFSQVNSFLSLDQVDNSILLPLLKIASNIDSHSNIFLTEMGVHNMKVQGWDFYKENSKSRMTPLPLQPRHKSFLQCFGKK